MIWVMLDTFLSVKAVVRKLFQQWISRIYPNILVWIVGNWQNYLLIETREVPGIARTVETILSSRKARVRELISVSIKNLYCVGLLKYIWLEFTIGY